MCKWRRNVLRDKTTLQNGRWESRIQIGNPQDQDEAFNIVLASANPVASQLLMDQATKACEAGTDARIERNLPSGVNEWQRVRVIRSDQQWGPAPLIPISSSSTSAPLIQIAGLKDGDEIDVFPTITGTLSTDAAGVSWLLAYTNGRWYPQSQAPCVGDHIRRSDDQWQTKGDFGRAGDGGAAYDLVAVLADESSSQFLDERLRAWCEAGQYQGLLTIELPTGLSEQDRVRVYRVPLHTVDTMNSRWGWWTGPQSPRAKAEITVTRGMWDNALQITYELDELGYIVVYKELWPGTLAGTKALSIRYSRPQKRGDDGHALQIWLGQESGPTFIMKWPDPEGSEDWATVVAPYRKFSCLQDEQLCPDPEISAVDPSKITWIGLAIEDKSPSLPSPATESAPTPPSQSWPESRSGQLIIDTIEAVK